jgi:hypothetical protein
VTEVTTEKHGGGLGRGKGELQVANMVWTGSARLTATKEL